MSEALLGTDFDEDERSLKNLGLDDQTASADSEGIEHHVSEKTLIKMQRFNKNKK